MEMAPGGMCYKDYKENPMSKSMLVNALWPSDAIDLGQYWPS